jgi:hypothetical protein
MVVYLRYGWVDKSGEPERGFSQVGYSLTNIKLGWKCLPGTNTLTYYNGS